MSKHRITISLSDSTVRKVDKLIDKKKIRNRSHAIEHLIQQGLSPTLETAVILAGEKKPNKDMIRPLTPVDDKPLIFHTLELLCRHGVENVIIVTNEFGKEIEKVVGAGTTWDLHITYVYEKQPQGTFGALQLIKKQHPQLLGSDSFYVLAGDVLTNINLADLAAFHQSSQKTATMAVKPRPIQEAYDLVYVQGRSVVDFKHSSGEHEIGIVNTGVYVFEQDIFSYDPDARPASLEDDVFPVLAQQQQLEAFTFQGIWYDISLDQNYKQVQYSV